MAFILKKALHFMNCFLILELFTSFWFFGRLSWCYFARRFYIVQKVLKLFCGNCHCSSHTLPLRLTQVSPERVERSFLLPLTFPQCDLLLLMYFLISTVFLKKKLTWQPTSLLRSKGGEHQPLALPKLAPFSSLLFF